MKLAQLDIRETNCKHGNYKSFEFFISELVECSYSDYRVNLPPLPDRGILYPRAGYMVGKSETNILIKDL